MTCECDDQTHAFKSKNSRSTHVILCFLFFFLFFFRGHKLLTKKILNLHGLEVFKVVIC